MPSTPSLLSRLRRDYPNLTFATGKIFRWSPTENTVYYTDNTNAASLLHEVAHALLKHNSYTHDIALLKMEREAWDLTISSLSKKYEVEVSEELAESMLDTYRDWLHDRSLCPTCQATGLQVDARLYTCLACSGTWRVNEARSCALRRYKVAT